MNFDSLFPSENHMSCKFYIQSLTTILRPELQLKNRRLLQKYILLKKLIFLKYNTHKIQKNFSKYIKINLLFVAKFSVNFG